MKRFYMFLFVLFSAFLFTFTKAQVELSPVYSSDRFQPSDKFHAGCENQLDIVFSLNYSNIIGVNAILEYNSNEVEILKILAEGEKENNLSYVVESNKIIFNKLKTQDSGLEKVVFKIFFKVDPSLISSDFRFSDGSYVLDTKGNMLELNKNYSFLFEAVPECEPDIIAPTIELLFPVLQPGEFIALDSYYQFNIYDLGKGVNKDKVYFTIDDIKYDLSNTEHERSGDILTIYPNNWLPLDSTIKLNIEVSDKQVYGKANTTKKEYSFKSSNELNLLNEIDPVQFRKLVNKEKYYQGSQAECDWLKQQFINSEESNQDTILSINKRLSCGDLDNLDKVSSLEEIEDQLGFSVFSILGRFLFGLVFFFIIFKRLSKK
ncbi:MAG: hypothetical protein M0P94_02585 [Candidatus Absconditabacterales bacterium]|nr:hypothetical protein [Candidatus Absconditabacterales bacterium]